MKKKQLLLFLSVLFLSLTAHAGSGIFLRGGDIDAGWEPLPEWEFIDEGDGVYTLTDKVLSGEFKVADATWNTINYGLNDDASIVPGVAVTMAYNGGNMKCVEPYTCSKITFTLKDDVATLLLEVAGYESSGIFLRGEITNWEPLANWQFIKEDEGVYALYDKKLAGRFKIGGNDWNTNNYGFNYYDPGSTFDINTPCVLISDGGDIMIDKIYNCTKITLTLQSDGGALLLVEGSVMYNSGLFLVGDVTSWTVHPDW